MAKRKPKSKPDEESVPDTAKKSSRTGLPLHVYLPPALRRAFEDLATANRRTLTEEVAIALEERLEKFGKWPPPAAP
jgi:hypothetical protein